MKNILQKIKSWFVKEPTVEDKINELITHVENPAHRVIYTAVLKNQIAYLEVANNMMREKCPNCGEHLPNTISSSRLLKLTVKTLDKLIILDDLIGIQPLAGPVGLIYKLRYKDHEEDDNITRMSLEVLSKAVEANSRKLHATWTIEAERDIKTQREVNIEDEIIDAVADGIAFEIISEVLDRIEGKSTKVKVRYPEPTASISVAINKAANDIAKSTRRGAGNFAIVSPMILAYLQTNNSHFVGTTDKPKKDSLSRLRYAGTLNGTTKIYCDVLSDKVIVGYKGSTGTDAGMVYSPYTLLMTSGPTIDPQNFTPRMTLMTRYGEDLDKLGKKYYKTLDIQVEQPDSVEEILLEQAS